MFGIVGEDGRSTLKSFATIVVGQSERQWDANHIRVSRKHQCIISTASVHKLLLLVKYC
jgi:hypothetical protein